MEAEKIIIAPIVTEKSNMFREMERKKYAFRVNKNANKNQIMFAINSLFGVTPEDCNIINVKSKPRSARTKSGMKAGRTATWKKAIVTLGKGDTIDIFEGA